MDVGPFVKFKEAMVDAVSKAIIGKAKVIELASFDILVGGHILFEDNPGLGKTTLAKAVARAMGCEFRRVQFTADLLPSDVTGTYILDGAGGFRFLKGPVFTQVLLADEINRSPPKTQSALLEAMQERQVTAENQTFLLPAPFLVFATQNPIEYEGTYPLPEAQMDRFTIRMQVGYPGEDDEVSILERRRILENELDAVPRVYSPGDIVELQKSLNGVFVDDDIRRYIVKVVAETRKMPGVDVGASPRGSIQLFHMCRAKAACSGRDYIVPEDVKELAEPVLAHRVVLSPDFEVKGTSQAAVIQDALKRVPVPKVGAAEG
ncbi:MAG TPA: MoxR family ATPase [Nitrososphaerales archaeon]|nr:MoxR family ATPase [Nitrososphaerales archaeon]